MEKVKRDWFDSLRNFYRLKSVCRRVGCHICDNVVSEADINNTVMDELNERIDDGDFWRDLCSFLSEEVVVHDSWDSETDYFAEIDDFEYMPLDWNDFDIYKSKVRDWLNENDLFEPDEDDEYETDTSLEDMLKGE